MKKFFTFNKITQQNKYIPYARQFIDREDIKSVAEILKGEYLTSGSTIEVFEKKIALYVGAKYAVSFSSGTSALHGAICVAGIKSGDEVITTPMTFAASVNCIIYQNGIPVFADINNKTYNIDPIEIEKNITENTKAIIPVDYTGQPVNLNEINKIAKKYELIVIEDAAHALGAKYDGRRIGSISDMTMFSFHPVKHITTGEGGIITTNNKLYYDKLIQFRNHGITRDKSKLGDYLGDWYYEMQFLGYNYRITDIQAALGISQLSKLDFFIRKRKEIIKKYNETFKEYSEITIPFQAEGTISSWHLYIIRLNLEKLSASRKVIFDSLRRENIGVNVHYIPVYYHPYYQELNYKKGLCPNAEKLYEEIITLPLYPKMKDKDVEHVIRAVIKIIKYYSKENK